MLLELAIGDAYGAGFEYACDTQLQANDLSAYRQHPHHPIPAGHYTDDTQMSLAIAEAIISREPWSRENLAQRFVEAFHRDPREGYASRFYQFLQQTHSGADFRANIRAQSDKSGAAMRACPLGVIADISELLTKTSLQAQLTHNTPTGIAAAQATALMTHYLIYQLGPKAHLPEFLETHIPSHNLPGCEWTVPWQGKVGAQGWMSVRGAIAAIVNHDRLSQILQASIAWGGDVDTVATIALGAASCSSEVAQDLPQHLVDGLENGTYGRDYLCQLNTQLMALVQ